MFLIPQFTLMQQSSIEFPSTASETPNNLLLLTLDRTKTAVTFKTRKLPLTCSSKDSQISLRAN